jgi:phage tail P2-like protein
MAVSIDEVSIRDYLTPAMQRDRFFNSAALALDPLFADIRAAINNNKILCTLANQPAAVLDFLAHWHFNLDVYDDTYSYGQKLALVQGAILNKIRKGTPSAVRAAMNVAFNYCELIEWWQDSPPGPPATFRIQIADPLTDPVKVNKMIATIIAVKNARSYFAGISSFNGVTPGSVYVSGAVGEYDYQILPYTPTVL